MRQMRQHGLHLRAVVQALAAGRLQQLTPGHREQPGVGRGGHALRRPQRQGFFKRGRQRVFGGRHIAPLAGQPGQQPAVGLAGRRVGGQPGGVGGGVHAAVQRRGLAGPPRWRRHHIASTGRTSIMPVAAVGLRAAQARASSSVATSITK